MKIVHVVGARPNFMKVAPIIESFKEHNRIAESELRVEQILVHTGQHYDRSMSALYFDNLDLPRPDINLAVGSGPHGEQTGRIMEAFEKILEQERPDLVLVVGDVNSTMACALDAKKMCIPAAHVEAGLRSRDMTMPEEINRIVTDAIADLLFTTDRRADENLKREGIPAHKIHFVGNVMIDTLVKHRQKALALPTLQDMGLKKKASVANYALTTLHRPGNVDDRKVLLGIGEALAILGRTMEVVFPIHPRTFDAIKRFKLEKVFSNEHGIRLLEPLGYLDFLNLQANARMIITDSGGVQEESTILGVSCLTLRPNTERPITIEQGTNRLVGNKKQAIVDAFEAVMREKKNATRTPDLWDGNAAARIVDVIVSWSSKK